MKNKNFLFYLTLFLSAFLFSCTSGDQTKDDKESLPNIILILSDDQGWGDYGFMGHEHIRTPNIDRIAEEGMTYTQGYVPASLCRPSLACLISGLYPHQHNILGNDPVIPDRGKYTWNTEFLQVRAAYNKKYIENYEKVETLPEMLNQKGYISYQSGKWWEGNHKVGGFTFGMTHGDPQKGGRHGDEGLKIGREGMDSVFNFIDFALNEDKPFFLWYAPFLPHSPHNPPDSLLQKYLPLAPSKPVAEYWAMCEFFDYTCGQLLNYTDEKGIMDNTLVVYVCDNGWVQEENISDKYAEPSKRSPYNTGVRTPIIFKWDQMIPAGLDSAHPVSSTDIVPTILGLLQLEPNENMHGINVLDKEGLDQRKAIYGEVSAHDFSTLDSSIYYRLTITNPYKLIVPDKTNKPGEEIQLFNIMEDPGETTNLAAEHPEIVKDLEQSVYNFMKK